MIGLIAGVHRRGNQLHSAREFFRDLRIFRSIQRTLSPIVGNAHDTSDGSGTTVVNQEIPSVLVSWKLAIQVRSLQPTSNQIPRTKKSLNFGTRPTTSDNLPLLDFFCLRQDLITLAGQMRVKNELPRYTGRFVAAKRRLLAPSIRWEP